MFLAEKWGIRNEGISRERNGRAVRSIGNRESRNNHVSLIPFQAWFRDSFIIYRGTRGASQIICKFVCSLTSVSATAKRVGVAEYVAHVWLACLRAPFRDLCVLAALEAKPEARYEAAIGLSRFVHESNICKTRFLRILWFIWSPLALRGYSGNPAWKKSTFWGIFLWGNHDTFWYAVLAHRFIHT